MALSVDQFVAAYEGKLINNGGVECVAVANQYEKTVVEGPWISANLASDWFKYYALDAVEKKYYFSIPASEPVQKGDLAVWLNYPTSGKPHIALVLADSGDHLYCFTQNPGAAHKESLVKTGLAGYLRPKKFVAAAVKLATPAEIDSAYVSILGRHADPNGLAHYQHYTIAFVKNDLANSPEKKKRDAARPTPSKPVVAAKYVTAAPGFTMWGYEQAHGLTHGRLQQLNPGVVPERIQIGQRIRVA